MRVSVHTTDIERLNPPSPRERRPGILHEFNGVDTPVWVWNIERFRVWLDDEPIRLASLMIRDPQRQTIIKTAMEGHNKGEWELTPEQT